MTVNHRKSLVNRCNALNSTGPRSAPGKRPSSQNSRKHGSNSAPDFESSLECQKLVDLIAGDGFSVFFCADIAAGLLDYRRVMDDEAQDFVLGLYATSSITFDNLRAWLGENTKAF